MDDKYIKKYEELGYRFNKKQIEEKEKEIRERRERERKRRRDDDDRFKKPFIIK